MISLQLAKNKMENYEGMNHLMIKVIPKKNETKVEKPVAFVLCIDVSGSMDDPAENGNNFGIHIKHREGTRSKLDFVKAASEKMLDFMRDGDQFSVITFSDLANIEYPLVSLDQSNRFAIKDRIRALRTTGCTNVSDGLQTSFSQISSQLKETHHIKIILLSDGEANRGITGVDQLSSIVSAYRKEHVSISSIGVGVHYNSYFMENIATSSGGMFYHLDSMDRLESILNDELKTLSSLTTKQAKLIISGPDGIHLEKNINDYSEEKQGEVYLGNVFHEQVLLFEFATKEKIPVGDYPLTATLHYLDGSNIPCTTSQTVSVFVSDEEELTDLIINDEVLAKVKEVMTAKTKKDSLKSYELGDLFNIHKTMTGHYASLQSLHASYGTVLDETRDDLDELRTLQEQMMNNSLPKDTAKGLYASNYKKLRNS